MDYFLSVNSNGELIVTTDYDNGFYTEWSVSSVLEIDEMLFFVSL